MTTESAPIQSPVRRIRNRDLRQKLLLDAATEVFRETGYDGATTKEIANRADCSESLLFRYFVDKRGVFEAVLSRDNEQLQRLIEDRLNEMVPATLEEYLEKLFLWRIEQIWAKDSFAKGSFMGIGIRQALFDQHVARKVVRPLHRSRTSRIAERIRHYQEQGQVRADVDPADFAEVATATINYLSNFAPILYGTNRKRTVELARAAIGYLLGGIRPSA